MSDRNIREAELAACLKVVEEIFVEPNKVHKSSNAVNIDRVVEAVGYSIYITLWMTGQFTITTYWKQSDTPEARVRYEELAEKHGATVKAGISNLRYHPNVRDPYWGPDLGFMQGFAGNLDADSLSDELLRLYGVHEESVNQIRTLLAQD